MSLHVAESRDTDGRKGCVEEVSGAYFCPLSHDGLGEREELNTLPLPKFYRTGLEHGQHQKYTLFEVQHTVWARHTGSQSSAHVLGPGRGQEHCCFSSPAEDSRSEVPTQHGASSASVVYPATRVDRRQQKKNVQVGQSAVELGRHQEVDMIRPAY